MTQAIPRHIFDPEAAHKEGTKRLVEWDTRIGEDGWDTGRLWWRASPRVEAASEYTRRGLGLVRWFDFSGLEEGDRHRMKRQGHTLYEPGPITALESTNIRHRVATYVNEALAFGRKERACGDNGQKCYPGGKCDVCDPPTTLTADTIKGALVISTGHMRYLGHVDPALGVAAMFKYLDELHPVPHPGFRAGQIWADSDGCGNWKTRQVARADPSEVEFAGARGIVVHLADPLPVRAILLHDPLQPRMAPWSP